MTIVEREVVEAPAVVPVTTRDVLHRAADLLEEFGWCQEAYGSKKAGAFCAVGAMWEAERELAILDSDLYWPEHALGVDDVPEWNDTPGRTKEEVAARLREAAEAAA